MTSLATPNIEFEYLLILNSQCVGVAKEVKNKKALTLQMVYPEISIASLVDFTNESSFNLG